jgi:predicted DNA-binding protein YlxM (UPF0122 family)
MTDLEYAKIIYFKIFGDCDIDDNFAKGVFVLIDTLKEREKKILEMRFRKNMIYDTIAKEFGITKQAVQSAVVSILKKLKKYIGINMIITSLQKQVEILNQKLLLAEVKIEKLENNNSSITKTPNMVRDLLTTPIKDLDFSSRLCNCLRRNGIIIINDLIEMTAEEVFNVKYLGLKCMYELIEKMAEIGFVKWSDNLLTYVNKT